MIHRAAMATLASGLLLVGGCGRQEPAGEPGPPICQEFPGMAPIVCELMGNRLVVKRESVGKLSFSAEGVGSIVVNSRELYYVDQTGKTARALPFDNDVDYFVEGLARTVKDGKVGFVNPSLDTVVAPVWDFAFPFQDGVAVVCRGCQVGVRTAGEEHPAVTGGKWGYIDTSGNVLVPVEHTFGSLPAAEAVAKEVKSSGRKKKR